MNSPITKLIYHQTQKNNTNHNNLNQKKKKDNLLNSNNLQNKNFTKRQLDQPQ
jgi:hypothetical protein